MSSLYESPEKYGMTVVGAVDAAGSYEFDIFSVWKDAEGKFYSASDSGCSCPTPFEGLGLDTVTGPETKHEVIVRLRDWADEAYDGYGQSSDNADVTGLIEKILDAG